MQKLSNAEFNTEIKTPYNNFNKTNPLLFSFVIEMKIYGLFSTGDMLACLAIWEPMNHIKDALQ